MNNNIPQIEATELIDLNANNGVSNYARDHLARYLEIDTLEAEDILFTNGADAAIHAISQTYFQDRDIAYLDLNYRYATELITKKALASTEIRTVRDFEKGERNLEEMPNKIDILYITNPDNRFGLLINRERMQSISLETIRRGAICIIDEAYMDYAPNHSLVKSDMTNTVIVRTFAKFFSLESSRIGYIIGDRKIIKKLKDFIPQYPIATSSIEKLVETISIDEKELLVKREQCARKKEKFYRFCQTHKIPYIHSHTNFVTILIGPKEVSEINFGQHSVKEFTLDNTLYFRVSLDKIEYREND